MSLSLPERIFTTLSDKIGERTVRCVERGVDRYQRTIAICYVGNEDLDGWLVTEGWALAFRKYSLDYVPQEESARAAGRGIWAGAFEMPWDWRVEHRSGANGRR